MFLRYVYDAGGTRVDKGTITSMSCEPASNGLTTARNETDYILGPGGEQVRSIGRSVPETRGYQPSQV